MKRLSFFWMKKSTGNYKLENIHTVKVWRLYLILINQVNKILFNTFLNQILSYCFKHLNILRVHIQLKYNQEMGNCKQVNQQLKINKA